MLPTNLPTYHCTYVPPVVPQPVPENADFSGPSPDPFWCTVPPHTAQTVADSRVAVCPCFEIGIRDLRWWGLIWPGGCYATTCGPGRDRFWLWHIRFGIFSQCGLEDKVRTIVYLMYCIYVCLIIVMYICIWCMHILYWYALHTHSALFMCTCMMYVHLPCIQVLHIRTEYLHSQFYMQWIVIDPPPFHLPNIFIHHKFPTPM